MNNLQPAMIDDNGIIINRQALGWSWLPFFQLTILININRQKDDNDLNNLQPATMQEQNRNKKPSVSQNIME